MTDRMRAPSDVIVRVTGLTKSYGRGSSAVRALDNVSLEVRHGEFLVLLGPSGCGKTTLLRSIAGLIEPTNGRIELHGEAVFDSQSGAWCPPNRRDVGMVFQQYALWPHMTVERNVAYPLRAKRRREDLHNGRVGEVLELVQCKHLAKRYPPELSGGQQQRVSLARALAARPAVMLMDEPLSNLDALLRLELRAELRRVHEELKFTSVYVTHDQVEALSLASRIVVMRHGNVVQVGTPDEVYRAPVNDYVAEFLGARARFLLVVDDQGTPTYSGQQLRQLSGRFPSGTQLSVRVRPSSLQMRSTRVADSDRDGSVVWLRGGVVQAALPGGEVTEFVVSIAGTRVTVEAPTNRYAFGISDEVELGFAPGDAFFYPVGARSLTEVADEVDAETDAVESTPELHSSPT